MKGSHTKTRLEKITATLLLFVFALGISAPLLLANPKPAQAQFSVPISDTQNTIVNIWDTLKDQFVGGAISALVNGANYFLSKLAYELAVSLTADCPGQVVCWDSKGFKEGFEEAWKGAVGEVVETLSEEGGFSDIGLNLCNPDVDLSMRLQLGLLDEAEPPEEPSCNFDSFLENWSSIGDQFTTEQVLGNFQDIFQPGNSELGISLKVLDVSNGLEADALREKGLNRLSEAAMGGFSDVTDPVSGRVKSPGSTVAKEYDRMKKEKEDDPRRSSESMSSGALARGAVMSVVMNFLQTFVQTFLGRLWNKFTDGLISTEEAIQSQPEVVLSEEGLFRPPGKKAAREILTRMLTPAQKDLGEVDPLLNFTVCPQQGRKPDNCVMDGQFSSAVRVAQATPFTVRQAIEESYLHGDWPLIPASDARNQDPHCYTQGYCESNLKKLRAARIIPIGWEIAASEARGVYAGIRLADVVDAFDDCNAEGLRDEFHPFCHLIDENWILLAPAAQCRVSGYGPRLASPSIPQRLEECVDYRTCLRQNDVGKCIGGWGYCTREKNVWRFNADSCPAEYNTCRTMTPAGGGTPVNYLLNTLDFGICNADNVGCAQYATDKNVVSCQLTAPCDEETGCQIEARIANNEVSASGGSRICRLPGNLACPDDGDSRIIAICACGNIRTGSCLMSEGQDYCLVGNIGTCTMPTSCNTIEGCYTGCTVANGQSTCSSSAGLEDATHDDWFSLPSRFFNDKVEACDARDAGCSTLYQLKQGQSLNLITNGSFEQQDDINRDGTPDRPSGWALPTGSVAAGRTGEVIQDTSRALHGGNTVRLSVAGAPLPAGVCTLAPPDNCADANGCPCTVGSYTCLVDRGRNSCPYDDRLMTDLLPMSSGLMHTVSAAFRSAEADQSFRALVAVTFYAADGTRINPASVVAAPLFSRYIEHYDPSGEDFARNNPCTLVGDELQLNFNTGIDGEVIDEIRAACSFFVTDPRVKFAAVELRLPNVAPHDVYVDAVQFEQGPLTPYHEGYNTSVTINAKVPPSYLGCAGEATDLPECNTFARMCRESEVGCKLYTPLNGDPAVPGIVGPQDYCPAECVGFDMFFQEPTDFEGLSATPDNFIPTTAAQCSAAEVGCTAFTNVDTEAVEYFTRLRICQAPEADDSKVYYTWEGSDTTGYQLRSWTLKRGGVEAVSNITPTNEDAGGVERLMTDICADGEPGVCAPVDDDIDGVFDSAGPCVKLAADNISCDDAPVDRTGYCSRRDIERGDFDCREFYDSNGHRHFRRLSRTIIATADCHLYRITDSSALDCPLWNGRWNGARGECIYSASPSWSYTCNAAAAGCRSYRGNAASNIQTLFVEDFEVDMADRWIGAGLTWSSESLVVGGHSVNLDRGNLSREIGAQVGENNLYTISFWARGNGELSTNIEPGPGGRCPSDLADEVVCAAAAGCSCVNDAGLSCTILNGEDNCIIPAAAVTISPATPPAPVSLTPEWRQFEIGPMKIGNPGGTAGRVSALLSLSISARGEAYIDNLVFKRVRDNITVIRNSWNTPLSCNRTREGIYSPLEMLGCRAYRGSDNQTYNLRSFSSLCRPESAGCEAYSQTQNTPTAVGYQTYGAVCDIGRQCGESADDAPNCSCDYSKPNPASPDHPFILTDVCRVPLGLRTCRFNLDGLDVSGRATDYPDRFVQPADERLYLVVGSQNMCAQSAVGCRSMGQPVIEFERQCKLAASCVIGDGCSCVDPLTGQDCLVESGKSSCQIALDEGVTASWKGAVIKDDPAKYNQTLCPMEAVGCEKYNASDGARYFKDPSNQVCQFRTNINYRGRKVNGWFRKSASGTVFPCYESFLRAGNIYDIYRNSDPLYTGWVGMCSAEYDRCEEFVDPLDTSASNPGGKPYYYLDNTKLNKSACQGQASLEEGCVLLKQTSNTQNLFSAAASYFRSWREANGALVNAVNCDSPGAETSPNCAQRCYSVAGGTCVEFENDVCDDDTDCGSAGKCISRQCRTVCNSDAQCGGGACEGEPLWGTGCSADANVCNQAKGEICLGYTPPAGESRNDANVIIKVRRDRDCAEWLECDKSQPVYDSNLGRWINRCISFSTCTEGAQVGDSFVCSELDDVPKELFTINDYVARDIGWNGEEYSGYSIVDRYPLQHLQAYKITTGQCRQSGAAIPNLTTRDGRIVRCRDTGQCEAACEPGGSADCAGRDIDEIYCSAPLNGICVGGSQAGLACDDDTHCKGNDGVGYCSQSQFDVIRFGIQQSLCREDNDHFGEPCLQDIDCFDAPYPGIDVYRGACASSCTQNAVTADGSDGCPPDGYQPICSSDGCPEPWGSCVDSACVYDYRGGPLRTDDVWNAPSCRAYPEPDSPFPANILDITSPNVSGDTKATPGYNKFGTPVKLKAPYRGANTCLEGNSCDCFYSRIGYGQGGTKVRYQSFDNSIKYREGTTGETPGPFQSGVSSGVCMGGPYDGMSCTPGTDVAPGEDGPCGPSGSAGTCMAYSSFALAAGWPGFCVDKDESDRLYADPNVPGCNLWLPVDVIPGMTDMLSQHLEAGFQSPNSELIFCPLASGNAYRGVCSNDNGNSCASDDDCDGEVCLPYIRLLQPSEGEPAHNALGVANDHWFHVDTSGDCGGGDVFGSVESRKHRDLSSGRSFSRIDLAGIRVVTNQGIMMLTPDNDFTFTVEWNEDDDNTDPNIPDENRFSFDADGDGEEEQYFFNNANSGQDCADLIDLSNAGSCGHGSERDGGDALERGCEGRDYTGVEANCMAARAEFNGVGEFVGIGSVLCFRQDDRDASTHAHIPVRFAGAYLRESCRQLSIVHNAANNPPSVAWTDRIYNLRSGYEVEGLEGLEGESIYNFAATHPGLPDGSEHTPLGVVTPGFSLWDTALSWPVTVVGTHDVPTSAGSPYIAWQVQERGEVGVEFIPNDPVLGYAIAAGFPLACIGTCRVPESMQADLPIGNTAFGYERLMNLFAKVFLHYGLQCVEGTDCRQYEYVPNSFAMENYFDERAAFISELDHQPPRIIPVNTTSSLCRDQGNTCPELGIVDGISVNGGQRDMCFGGGNQSNVEISYYAYADSDHMPIRRHIIDFGDGTTPVQLAGSFKNTRGLTTDGTPICGSDNTDFGLTPDACDSSYMRFNKTYTCSESFAATLPKCLANTAYPCRDAAGCCVFKPRVQVMDNWGVCNGVCPNDPSGETDDRADGNLCFNGSTVNYLDESHDASNEINECTILSAVDRDYQPYRRPFVAYSGVIVVCPNNCSSDGMTYWPVGCPAGTPPCMDGACSDGLACVHGCCVAP